MRCPRCKKHKLYRVITPCEVLFKGEGWPSKEYKQSGSKSPQDNPATRADTASEKEARELDAERMKKTKMAEKRGKRTEGARA